MSLREEIIHTAMRLFSVKGYERTSLMDLLDAVGTSKGGFYNYFKSKDDLYYAVLSEAKRIWRECCLAGLDEIEDPVEKLKMLLVNYRDRYLKRTDTFPGGCIFLSFSVGLDGSRPDLIVDVTENFNRLKARIKLYLDEGKDAGRIRADVNTTRMAQVIFSTMLGSSVVHRADKSMENLDNSIGSILSLIESIEIKKKSAVAAG